MQAPQNFTVFYKINNQSQWEPAKANQCLYDILGNRIDLQWNYTNGILRLSPATQQGNVCYQFNQNGVEYIKGAYFCHGESCPLLREDVQKNPNKSTKACACVMLYNKNKKQFLMTERSPNLRTYPKAWVLPGGHLETGEGLFQGGIRQCCQQVGLPRQKDVCIPLKQNCIMVWQSVFAVEKSVKATAMVVFFVAECKQFEVKTDPNEVSAFKWKNIDDKSDQIRYSSVNKVGYAEGHLKYLEIVRNLLKL